MASSSRYVHYEIYDSLDNLGELGAQDDQGTCMDLDDGLNSPPYPLYSRRYRHFAFDSESFGYSGCSSVVCEIPHSVVDLDKNVVVNKRNLLKAFLEKMTKKELTPVFLADLVSLSRSDS